MGTENLLVTVINTIIKVTFRMKGMFSLILPEGYESITGRKHASKQHRDSHHKTLTGSREGELQLGQGIETSKFAPVMYVL